MKQLYSSGLLIFLTCWNYVHERITTLVTVVLSNHILQEDRFKKLKTLFRLRVKLLQ
jgi:hypothetical protein